MNRSNELRVFISSTFRDLKEEREHLVKKIFPEVRSLCRERGITFTEVDLRWGLTEEDVALGQVIRTCLEEIDRCRPYFIGITGERYGYVPDVVEIYKDPELLRLYPWIEDSAMEGASIIDLEFRHAVRLPVAGYQLPEEEQRARFFFRRGRRGQESEVGVEEQGRLERLKQRVRDAGLPVEEFRDPVSLGEMVYDHLTEILDRDFADVKPPSELEQERARHEAFAASRRQAYIPNVEYLTRLNEFAVAGYQLPVASTDQSRSSLATGNWQPATALVIYAESGSGKSSLVSFWCQQQRRKNPQQFIIEHYVGIGAGDTDHLGIIRHVMAEIKERFNRPEPIPSKPEELEASFATWLSFVKDEGGRMKDESEKTNSGLSDSSIMIREARGPHPSSLLLVLDGINQLSGTALNLAWLPRELPSNVKLIITSTVESTLVALRDRGWSELGMQPLNQREREAVIVRFLSEYHKALSREQLMKIAEDVKCSHPLFLRTLLEELRLDSDHQKLDGHIEHYLSTTGTEDLFQKVLERIEGDYNTRSVQQVMRLIWASRNGLSETELSELTGMSRMKLSSMLMGLDYHLVRKGGLLTFFHDYLRRAVMKRYCADEEKQRAAHMELVEYFERQPASQRTSSELAWQLNAAGEMARLARVLSTIPHLMVIHRSGYDALKYWAAIGDEVDMMAMLQAGLERWRAEERNVSEQFTVLSTVAVLFEMIGRTEQAIHMHQEELALAIDHGDRLQEARARERIGINGWMIARQDMALEELTKALLLFEELEDLNGIYGTTGNLGVVHMALGDNDRALECFQTVEAYYVESGNRRGLGRTLGNLGAISVRRGDNDRAIEYYQRAMDLSSEFDDYYGVLMSLGGIGQIQMNRGEYDHAYEFFQKSESVARMIGFPQGITSAINGRASIYLARGEFDEALQCHRESEKLAHELGDRSGAALNLGNMGDAYEHLADYERALECYGLAAEEHRVLNLPVFVSAWLSRTASVLLTLTESFDVAPAYLSKYVRGFNADAWRESSLRRARQLIEESMDLAPGQSNEDETFLATMLLARIDHAQGDHKGATARIDEMQSSIISDDKRATLYYWRWKMQLSNDLEADRSAAIDIYQRLIEKTPRHDYKTYLGELRSMKNNAPQ